MTARWPRAAGPLLGLFAVLALVHLGALLGDVTTVAQLTKPALMPVLTGYALARGGPPLLAGALLFGCGGDTFLQIGGDLAFLVGMGSFAAGHVCYLLLFVRHGARPGGGRPGLAPALAAAYGAVLAVTVVLLWPDLPAELRIPVAGYSLLLTAMAFGALRAGLLAAVGGLLFLLSDTLIASGIAHWPQLPLPQFWIMLTYAAAQYALAGGVLRAAATAPRPAPDRPRAPRTADIPSPRTPAG
ncbi:lysoplasmalogenase [Streptomyces sioyaensis]|uniref:Lysoplasmalogenase n=1 Tax=Streptomyces sioyaensis TaxID=67364 RepID=A0A4Q1QKB1_9ACTN|nr:lysoplasmalogenase [Streptomyces sioyaensis]MBM4790960.1 lysoplasmalogenase [Streptomyces sioyaensis]RXS61034.1 lysoplasmalogenase [Streptomyces sioyaensis]